MSSAVLAYSPRGEEIVQRLPKALRVHRMLRVRGGVADPLERSRETERVGSTLILAYRAQDVRDTVVVHALVSNFDVCNDSDIIAYFKTVDA